MPEPIVFISRHRIAEGRADEFGRAYAAAVDLIRATKPGTTLFAAYVDATGTEVRVVHVFADADAMARHFEGSAERSRSAAGLITPVCFEIYGRAPRPAIDPTSPGSGDGPKQASTCSMTSARGIPARGRLSASASLRRGGRPSPGRGPGSVRLDPPDQRDLVVELASLVRAQRHQRLHRDHEPAAGSPLVPDAADDAVDEHDREVAGLARGRRACRGRARVEQLAWLARDDERVEVRQQPDPRDGRLRRRRVAGQRSRRARPRARRAPGRPAASSNSVSARLGAIASHRAKFAGVAGP